jgi:hypothetical protein
MNTIKIKLVLMTLLCCWGVIAEAQMANVTYSTRSGFVRSSDAGCQDGDTEEYTAYLWTSDNANGTEGTTGCQSVNFDGTLTWLVNTPVIVSNRTNGSWVINARIDAWEEDSDNRCVFQSAADDCRQTASQSFDFRALASPSNGGWTNGPAAGSTSNHQYAIGVTWKYVTGGSSLTPALSCNNTGTTLALTTGRINSWQVAMTAGVSYHFSASGKEIRIYDPNGYSLLSGPSASINYVPGAGGTYFVEVSNSGRAVLTAGNLLYRINDVTTPTVATCPGNISVNAAAGTCGAVVTYATPTFNDNCPVTVTRTAGLASGSTFPVGTTTVTHTGTDQGGRVATCSFTVTVVDNQAPAISCPANISVNTTLNTCGAAVSYTTPTGTDNCPGATTTQIGGLASGSTFGLGTTTNTFRVTAANGATATCSFTVTVTDNQAPTISCPSDITVFAASGTCAANVTYTAPTAGDNCPGVGITRIAGPASGSSFPVGTTTITHRATAANGQTADCSFTVTVIDNEPPSISCPADVAVAAASGTCGAVVSYGAPVAGDNCSGVTTTQTGGFVSGATFPVGVTTNTFQVTAANGQTATCSFTVTVVDNQAPAIACPANISSGNDLGQCAANVTYTAPTGTDNCPGSTTAQIAGSASGASFPVGTTTNTFRVTAANGQTATCSFTVTVNDTENPTITCPANISVANDLGVCGAAVSYSVSSTDNCSGQTVAQTGGLASGATFPVGSTTNSFTVTDASGNTATCSFTVSVADTENPTITCPANISVVNDLGVCGAAVSYSVTSTDNCPAESIAQTGGLASGSTFPVGSTTNSFTVTDASGNTATCSFTVSVADTENPTITCPANISVVNDLGVCGAAVSYSVTSTDNCPAESIAQTGGLASGATFPIGSTTNSFTVTDASGNTATCSFTVSVADTENPTITCPANISVVNDLGVCGAAVSYSVTSTDNCPAESIAQTGGLASGATFPVGSTTNSFTVTDASGNTATCSFTVSVADTENPTITCPANISVVNDLGVCGAAVSYSVTSTDNCPAESIAQTGGLASGATFPVGSTTNSFTVTDASGNTATCSFTVSVADTENPTITCPANISVVNDLGVCGAAVSYSVTSTDNCPAESIAQTGGLASGATFPVGSTTNSFTVTDASGNTATCSFTVSVADTENPTITCPANISVNTDLDVCGAAVSYSVTSTDNCPAESIAQTGGLAAAVLHSLLVTTSTTIHLP